MDIHEALCLGAKKIKDRNIKVPHLEAEILLSKTISKPREYLLAHPESEISKIQEIRYQQLLKKRSRGTPIAYLIGEKEFYGLKFFVNKHVLIPRPETELMVDEALDRISNIAYRESQKTIVVDIGTGSGNIIITIAKKLNCELKIKNYEFYGLDISKIALSTAKKNSSLHKTNKIIKFKQGDLLEPILKLKIRNQKSEIIILANLPYLTPDQLKSSSTIKFEPKLALTAGKDGLKYYRQLFKQLHKLQIMGHELCALCEIDPSQTVNIKKLIKRELPGWKYEIKKDLKGHNRLVRLDFNI